MRCRIAIVDDEERMRERAREIVERILPRQECSVRCYGGGSALLADMEEGEEFDIFLLDIEMPEMDGLLLAQKIREKKRDGAFVFLTSYEKYAIRGYEIHAFAYVLKGEMEARLPEVLGQLREQMVRETARYYVIETANRFEKFRYEDILYIYKEDKNCLFVTECSVHRERIGLEDARRKLGAPEFVYIDKGQIVNIGNIAKIVKDTIYFPDGSHVIISRANIRKVKMAVSAYWRDRI